MKKFLSIILALAMVACMSVTAFAADGTTVLTAEIPNKPSYTLHVPANMNLEVGNTDMQTIGDVSVTDVEGYTLVATYVKYTNLINKDNAADEISLAVYDLGNLYLFNASTGLYDKGNGIAPLFDILSANMYHYDAEGYGVLRLGAQVSDWSGATAGATYQATITYTVYTR